MTTTKWFFSTRKKTSEFIKLQLKIRNIFIFIRSARSLFFFFFRHFSTTAKFYFDFTYNKFLKDVPTCLLNIDFFFNILRPTLLIYWIFIIQIFIHITVKLLNSEYLRVLKKLSVIERFLLLEGNFKKIVTFGALCFVRFSWHVRYLGCPLLGGFAVHISTVSTNLKKTKNGINENICPIKEGKKALMKPNSNEQYDLIEC